MEADATDVDPGGTIPAAATKDDQARAPSVVGEDAPAEEEEGEIDPNVMNVLAARLRFAEKMLMGRKKQKEQKLKQIAADKIALVRVTAEIEKCEASMKVFADGLPEKEQTRLMIIKQMKDFEAEIVGICKTTRAVAKKALWQAAQQNKQLARLQNETTRGFSMRSADQPYKQAGWGTRAWAEGGSGHSPRRPMREKNKFGNPSPRSASRGSRGSRSSTGSKGSRT